MKRRLRFADLVRNFGKPDPLTLWTKPEKNLALTIIGVGKIGTPS